MGSRIGEGGSEGDYKDRGGGGDVHEYRARRISTPRLSATYLCMQH